MSPDDPSPKLHVDTDWKAEAQAEKERLTAAEKARAEKPGAERPGGAPHELPEASFRTLAGMLASQAIMGLGALEDPETKGRIIDLDGARLSIDLLAVLEEKTKGNLSDEEQSELTQLLAELRTRFVQVTQLLAQQAAAGGAGGQPPPATPITP